METYTEPEDIYVTLDLEDGTELECLVLLRFPLLGRQYAALIPAGSEDDPDAEIYLYRFGEDENGEAVVGNIEDDEEYEAVSDRYDEILDEIEYEEMGGDDVVDEPSSHGKRRK